MITYIYNFTQPFMIIIPIIAGICSLILSNHRLGVVNLCIAVTNFFIFYGDKILK